MFGGMPFTPALIGGAARGGAPKDPQSGRSGLGAIAAFGTLGPLMSALFGRRKQQKATPAAGELEAPIATPAAQSASIGAANRAAARVRAGGGFLGGVY